MAFLKDFKEFAMKGNVVDLAVWVVIGTAFGKIVSSLVADIFTPVLAVLTKGVDFSKLAYTTPEVAGVAATMVPYGKFLQATFDFVVIAFAVFIFVSLINKTVKKPAPAPAAVPADIALLTEIRDALAGKKPTPAPVKKAAPAKKPAAKKAPAKRK